jgi:hypothetical protein
MIFFPQALFIELTDTEADQSIRQQSVFCHIDQQTHFCSFAGSQGTNALVRLI